MIELNKPDDTGRIVELLLDNKLGLDDLEAIEAASRNAFMARADGLFCSPLPGRLNYGYYKKMHKALFGDLWPWAGKDRQDLGLEGGLRKQGMDAHFTPSPEIKKAEAPIFSDLSLNRLMFAGSLDKFAGGMACLWNEINKLHPFIEGNGRTTRLFLYELSRRAGIRFVPDKIPHEEIIAASDEGMHGNTSLFKSLIKEETARCESNLAVFERNIKMIKKGVLPQSLAPLTRKEYSGLKL